MRQAVFVVTATHDTVRRKLTRDLERRFGADYDVLGYSTAKETLAALVQLKGHRDVALLLADEGLEDMPALDYLAKAHEHFRRAKRLLLHPWRNMGRDDMVVTGMTLGIVDCALATPWDPADENLYPLVAELVSDWCRSAGVPHFEAVQVIGEQWAPRSHVLRDTLDRSAVPYGFYAADSAEGQRLLHDAGLDGSRLPVVIVFGEEVLVDPTNTEVAAALGVMTRPEGGRYDLVIVGAGPAGLSAAVYGASEGLRTLLVEGDALGGQAGTSSRIRNYLGFPHGVSGRRLTAVATTQARFFGARLCYAPVEGLRPDGTDIVLDIGEGDAHARAVILAVGVRYRRLGIPALEALLGTGVFYGTAASEAPAMADQDVFVVGGGNSAGQAAVNLSNYAKTVTMIVREDALVLMSDYLVKEIDATPNIAVRFNDAVVDGGGAGRLEQLTLRSNVNGELETVAAAALFVLIGATPQTGWLPAQLLRDESGYLVTGRDLGRDGLLPEAWPLSRPPFHLETSIPGVFAVGDVRHRSVKRVASAVGEGSIAVQMVHQHLQG